MSNKGPMVKAEGVHKRYGRLEVLKGITLEVQPAEVMCILYRDDLGMRRYADRRILHGTITQQIDQAEAFFKQYIPVPAYMDGFHRRDVPDYPSDALR